MLAAFLEVCSNAFLLLVLGFVSCLRRHVWYPHLELCKNLVAVSVSVEQKGGISGGLLEETGMFSGYILILTFCIWCQGRKLPVSTNTSLFLQTEAE